VPEIVFASLDTAFGRTEPDEEIQDLLKASVGNIREARALLMECPLRKWRVASFAHL